MEVKKEGKIKIKKIPKMTIKTQHTKIKHKSAINTGRKVIHRFEDTGAVVKRISTTEKKHQDNEKNTAEKIGQGGKSFGEYTAKKGIGRATGVGFRKVNLLNNRRQAFAAMKRYINKHGTLKGSKFEEIFHTLPISKQKELNKLVLTKQIKNGRGVARRKVTEKQKYIKMQQIKMMREKIEAQKKVGVWATKKAGGVIKNAAVFISKNILMALKGITFSSMGIFAVIIIAFGLFISSIFASPFGVFVPTTNNMKSVADATKEIHAEYTAKINDEQSRLDGAAISEVIYVDYEGNGETVNNIIDVMVIYGALYGNPDDNHAQSNAFEMNEVNYNRLKEIFYAMNDYSTGIVMKETTNEAGEVVNQRVKEIRVVTRAYTDMIDHYHISGKQLETIEYMMKPGNLTVLLDGASVPAGSVSLSPEEWEQINANLKPGEIGSEVVRLGLTQLGIPYSQAKRFTQGYYDCSSFCYTMYKKVGIDMSYGGGTTAAAIGQWGVTNNRVISKEMLAPGDLIFWSGWSNGRFKNITHVAIYAGDGMIVESSSGKGMVVYRKMWGANQHVLYIRPYEV